MSPSWNVESSGSWIRTKLTCCSNPSLAPACRAVVGRTYLPQHVLPRAPAPCTLPLQTQRPLFGDLTPGESAAAIKVGRRLINSCSALHPLGLDMTDTCHS